MCTPIIIPRRCAREIDRINDIVYPNVNNGVYRAGFATSQAAYEEAARAIFATFDQLEERLSHQRYLVGRQLTEADWRLFTTLIRFDTVYYSHFKCNLRRIADYPNLWNYLRDLYPVPGIAETVSIDHIKRHYYGSQRQVNPTGIVPIGPLIDFTHRTIAAVSGKCKRAEKVAKATCRSPEFGNRAASEHLGDALARCARGIVRQRAGREEAVRDDFAVRLRRRDLPERTHNIERHVIAPRYPAIEIDGVEHRRPRPTRYCLLRAIRAPAPRATFRRSRRRRQANASRRHRSA